MCSSAQAESGLCGAGEEGRSEDGIQAPSGDLSLDVDVGAAGGPGESIWPLVIEAPSLTRGTRCLEDSAEWGVVDGKNKMSAEGAD